MEYYSVVKKKKHNEVLIHPAKWMNLENIPLSERRQSQKETLCDTIPKGMGS